MGDGFTGLDATLAQNQIDDFVGTCWDLWQDYNEEVNYFIYQLGVNWSSPNAVQFYNTYGPKLWAIRENFKSMYNSIGVDATDAYNSLATSNGAEAMEYPMFCSPNNTKTVTESDYQESEYFTFNPYRMLVSNPFSESRDGVTGMNVDEVTKIYGYFKEGMSKVISGLSEVSTEFAVYDPDGSLQASFRTRVNNMVNTLTDTTTAMYNTIDSALTTEQNIVRTGQAAAESTLAG